MHAAVGLIYVCKKHKTISATAPLPVIFILF